MATTTTSTRLPANGSWFTHNLITNSVGSRTSLRCRPAPSPPKDKFRESNDNLSLSSANCLTYAQTQMTPTSVFVVITKRNNQVSAIRLPLCAHTSASARTSPRVTGLVPARTQKREVRAASARSQPAANSALELGLAVQREITDQHGQQLPLRSTPGKR